jgi:hypothetical protein
MNSFVGNVVLRETPLFVTPYDILDSTEQEHATIRVVVLFWVSLFDLDFMLTTIKPIRKFDDVGKDLSCGFTCLIGAFVFGNAIVNDDFLVDDLGKKPVVSVVDGNNDLILFADIFSFKGP